MREVEAGGRSWTIRPLKRKEIKQLRVNGMRLPVPAYEVADEACDAALEIVLDPEVFKAEYYELDNPEVLKLWKGLLMETYPYIAAKDEEKNSAKSGAGSQTKKD